MASCQYKASAVNGHVLPCYTEPCARTSLSSAGVHMPLMHKASVLWTQNYVCVVHVGYMSLWVGINKLWIWTFDSKQNLVQQLHAMLVTWLLWPCAGKLKSFNSQHSHWWQYPLMYSSMVRILWMNEWVWWSTLTPLPSLIANYIHPHTFFLLLWTATVCWGWQMWVGLVLWMASSIQ